MQTKWALVRWFPWLRGQSRELKGILFIPLGQCDGSSRQQRRPCRRLWRVGDPREAQWIPFCQLTMGMRLQLVLMMLGLGCTVLLCQVPQKGVLALASVV